MLRIEYRDLNAEQVLWRIIVCTDEDIKAMPFKASNGMMICKQPGGMGIGCNYLDVGRAECRKRFILSDASIFNRLKVAVREFNSRNKPEKTSEFFEIAE